MNANEFYIVEDKDGNILNKEYIEKFMEQERWLPIQGYEGLYEVSNWGNVKSLKKENILKPMFTTNGYKQVFLSKNGKQKWFRIHRLVLINFLGLPVSNNSRELQVNHLDENKNNNFLNNLLFVTPTENINWGTRNQRASKQISIRNKGRIISDQTKQKMSKIHQILKGKEILQLDLEGNFIKKWSYISEVDKFYNKKMQSNITQCCRGKRNTAYGFKWEYAEENLNNKKSL